MSRTLTLVLPAGAPTPRAGLAAEALEPLVGNQQLPPGEGELRRAALQGDGASWSVLIGRYNHKVVVSLLGRGVPLERARELAQEAWLRLIENQRAGRLTELVLPGLAIVQAGFLAQNERRGAGQAAGLFGAEKELADTAHGAAPVPPEDHAIARQRLERVSQALATCPPSARRVFEYVYSHPELSYDEAASRLQLSTQRTKQIVCEVRKRLRAALEER